MKKRLSSIYMGMQQSFSQKSNPFGMKFAIHTDLFVNAPGKLELSSFARVLHGCGGKEGGERQRRSLLHRSMQKSKLRSAVRRQ